jgi:chromosome segregation ATPase
MATKEQIWAAADAISAEGGNPTLAAVRAQMGGGSYTDISAAMQSWRATQQASSTPIRESAPSAITERLNSLGAELWAVALELANNRLQTEREALEQARQETEETRKEAAALADALAADLDKAQADIAALREQLAVSIAKQEQQQAIINQETAAVIESKHRAELAEVAREELKTRADQISELLRDEKAANKANQTRQEAEIDRIKAEASQQAEKAAETIFSLRTALEKSQQDKAKLDGMLTVFESIGGKQAEPAPVKPPRKSKQAKEQSK